MELSYFPTQGLKMAFGSSEIRISKSEIRNKIKFSNSIMTKTTA